MFHVFCMAFYVCFTDVQVLYIWLGPHEHTTLNQHWINLDSTSWRWIKVDSMFITRCMTAGVCLLWRWCAVQACCFGSSLFFFQYLGWVVLCGNWGFSSPFIFWLNKSFFSRYLLRELRYCTTTAVGMDGWMSRDFTSFFLGRLALKERGEGEGGGGGGAGDLMK